MPTLQLVATEPSADSSPAGSWRRRSITRDHAASEGPGQWGAGVEVGEGEGRVKEQITLSDEGTWLFVTTLSGTAASH